MNVQIQRWGRGVGFYLFVSFFCILTVSPITFLLVGCANTRQSASLTAEQAKTVADVPEVPEVRDALIKLDIWLEGQRLKHDLPAYYIKTHPTLSIWES